MHREPREAGVRDGARLLISQTPGSSEIRGTHFWPNLMLPPSRTRRCYPHALDPSQRLCGTLLVDMSWPPWLTGGRSEVASRESAETPNPCPATNRAVLQHPFRDTLPHRTRRLVDHGPGMTRVDSRRGILIGCGNSARASLVAPQGDVSPRAEQAWRPTRGRAPGRD